MLLIIKMIKSLLNVSLLTIALFVCGNNFAISKTFHFSSSEGDDTRSVAEAQNPDTPWKSIEKLNSIFRMLLPGDSVKFKAGDVFIGEIKAVRSGIPNNPIRFDQYGSGKKPVLTTMVQVKDWVSKGGNLYEANLHDLDGLLNVLTIDDVVYPMGRYPNADTNNNGYLTIESVNENAISHDNQIRQFHDFSGAEVVIRKNNWIIDRHTINRVSGGTISYLPVENGYQPKNGFGFFFQNHAGTLDRSGEWFFDPATKKLMLYFDKGNPASTNIQVATGKQVINIQPKVSNINFHNLEIKGANEKLISVDQGSNIKFDNCDLLFSGHYSIHAVGSTNLTVENSRIEDALNGAVFLQWEDRGTIIRNNTFNRIFPFPGMGKNGEMQSSGIYMSETSYAGLIVCNRFQDMGYIAINFNGNKTEVKNNLIDTYCTVKDDGAAIYTYSGKENKEFSDRKVIGNIIINGKGAREGTKPYGPNDLPYVEGIYIDDNASGVEIKDNLIANVEGSGIFLHNARNIILEKNQIYHTGNGLKMVHDDLGDPIRNIRMTDNYFFNSSPDREHIVIKTKEADIKEMGDFKRNHYAGMRSVKPRFGVDLLDRSNRKRSSKLEFQDWCKTFGFDTESTQETTEDGFDITVDEQGEVSIKNGEFKFPTPKICATETGMD